MLSRLILSGAVLVAAGAAAAQTPVFRDVTDTNLPAGVLNGASMDARAFDADGDGDLDILVACEFCPNILLINDGNGVFTDESAARIPRTRHDSENIGVSDFDGDGDLDVFIASEDDAIHDFWLNDGTGHFADAGDRIPVRSVTNGVVVADIDGDGWDDLVLAVNGQDHILINDGVGGFRDETAARLPAFADITQGIALGDIDGDGDPDMIFSNEGLDRILLNDGSGVFSGDAVLPAPAPDETREIDLADIDGDGDLDAFAANVRTFMDADPQNRIYVNQGDGTFTEETAARLPPDRENNFYGAFVDIDGDGDPDIVTAHTDNLGGPGSGRVRIYINDGTGVFTDETARFLPDTARGNGFDLEFADFDGDGDDDLYLANRHGADRLFLRE
ncbi:MAG: VCBS repeat-containing protein [Bauldia sp.]|nr:VCBS repeat-containing protein [Bauldia sp.]